MSVGVREYGIKRRAAIQPLPPNGRRGRPPWRGYAVIGAPEREAVQLFAQNEGVLLDPVYSGRAAAGLIGLIRQRVIRRDEHVLFRHTGEQRGCLPSPTS